MIHVFAIMSNKLGVMKLYQYIQYKYIMTTLRITNINYCTHFFRFLPGLVVTIIKHVIRIIFKTYMLDRT